MVKSGFDRRVRGGELTTLVVSVMTSLEPVHHRHGFDHRVSERQRELAVLRSVGRTRGQVFRSQILLGLWLGVIGGLGGIPFGLALTRVVAEVYADKLPDGMLIDWPGIVRALIGATTAGVLGAVYPAWLASRTTPLTASPTSPATTVDATSKVSPSPDSCCCWWHGEPRSWNVVNRVLVLPLRGLAQLVAGRLCPVGPPVDGLCRDLWSPRGPTDGTPRRRDPQHHLDHPFPARHDVGGVDVGLGHPHVGLGHRCGHSTRLD